VAPAKVEDRTLTVVGSRETGEDCLQPEPAITASLDLKAVVRALKAVRSLAGRITSVHEDTGFELDICRGRRERLDFVGQVPRVELIIALAVELELERGAIDDVDLCHREVSFKGLGYL